MAGNYAAIVTYHNVNLSLDFVTVANNVRGGLISREATSNHTITNSIFYNPDAEEEVGRRTGGSVISWEYTLFSSDDYDSDGPYCTHPSGEYICGEGVVIGNPQFNADFTAFTLFGNCRHLAIRVVNLVRLWHGSHVDISAFLSLCHWRQSWRSND